MQNVYYVLKASLSTLHNIARSADVRHYFKENKTSEVSTATVALGERERRGDGER